MELEEKLKLLRDKKIDMQALTQKKTDLQKGIDELILGIIEAFEARNIKSMKLEGIGNFITVVKSYPKVTDHVALRDWMNSNNFDYSIVQMFSASKFKGFYRELLDNKQPLPPGCENYTEKGITVKKYVG